MKKLKILLLEAFYSGSHKTWAEQLKSHSQHDIDIVSLPGRHWKWRMHGAAVTFAEKIKHILQKYDILLTTDMTDVATLRGLVRIDIPVIAYFHENQLAYPWSLTDTDVSKGWDRRYVWINYTTALAADHLWFNSRYNMDSFLNQLPAFFHAFPDFNKVDVADISAYANVLSLGIDLISKRENSERNDIPIILWNHRWEYDKGPELFFNSLMKIKYEGLKFKLIVLGTSGNKNPKIFAEAKEKLNDEIIQWGSVSSREEYKSLLQSADILPVTAIQDFFGISVVEAISAGCTPVLPHALAYPEHISPDDFPKLYYNSEKEFLTKLKALFFATTLPDLSSQVEKYAWKKMIKKYDHAFTSISN